MAPLLVAIALVLAGCRPSPVDEAKREAHFKAEQARNIELCRDNAVGGCPGVAPIKQVPGAFMLHKWNNLWFKVPDEYYSSFGMSFHWPSKSPGSKGQAKPLGTDGDVQLQIRSHDIPPPPFGYRIIEAAERDGRIVNRETVRPGLDRVEFFPLHSFSGERSKKSSVFYVATDRRDPQGLPPVLGCNSDSLTKARGGAGAGFMWRDGIFVGVLIREGHVCEDWPELFDEVMRVLNLVERV